MHITKVELQNFKRFTNLTIDGIPADTRLVLLIGSNGSGKSSVFDAFEVFNSASKVDTSRLSKVGQRDLNLALSIRTGDRFKKKDESYQLTTTTGSETHTLNSSELTDTSLKENSFYGRSSFRQVSRLVRRQSDESFDIENDSNRPLNFIDRDFISDSEIEYLHKKYPNHYILVYYCFEYYLYHPNNIAKLGLNWFNNSTYVDAIRRLKREQVDYILPSFISSRQRYEEFNNDPKLDYKDIKSIVDDFKSDELERFYKFFSMKGQQEKIDIALGKIPQKSLAKTAWFRQQIESILNH